MKRTKSITALMTFALFFACVVSCDEQDERPERKKDFTFNTHPSTNTSNGHVSATAYTSAVGDPIDLATAQKWTANYRKTLINQDERLAHYFGFEIIQQILNQTDCIGIRIYYGLDDTGKKQLMLVGVDSSGENLLPAANGKVGDEGNVIADASFPCPNTCPDTGL